VGIQRMDQHLGLRGDTPNGEGFGKEKAMNQGGRLEEPANIILFGDCFSVKRKIIRLRH
jgi:hypothetical protein